MKHLHFILAIMIALAVGLSPVIAGKPKLGAPAMQDCVGKVKPACPCGDSSAPCATAICKVPCSGMVGLAPTTGQTQAVKPSPIADTAEAIPPSFRSTNDPPVPRS